jgi:hypothetical protein
MKAPVTATTKKRGPDRSKLSVDQKYDSYTVLHSNLDSLIWNHQATLLGITVLGLGALGVVSEKELSIGPFNSDRTLGIVLFILGVLYSLTIFTQWRMAYWHDRVESELRKLEPGGYFHLRGHRQRLWSAKLWNGVVFLAFAAVAFGGACYFWFFER